jgi:hypothetical protein
MLSYDGQIFFGLYADPDALPRVHQLPDLLAAEIHALTGLAAPHARQVAITPTTPSASRPAPAGVSR